MNEITLPPSPNWYLSSILACASDGTIAWGARRSIVISKAKDNSTPLHYKIIEKAHFERVTSIAFSPKDNEKNSYRLVSGGDDNIIKVWDLETLSEELRNVKLDNTHKVIAVDWSKHNSNLICGVSEDGLLVTWTINYDNSQIINLGKLTATCLACCPHDSNIVSIGSKTGLIYVVDIRGSGNILYKLRGHDTEIVSLSWCPVSVNIFENKDEKEFLLASGAKDKAIYLWKASTDGRYQVQLTFPSMPLDSQIHKGKMSSGNYTALCWLEPTTLLSSSPWGELLLWNLAGSEKKKFLPQLVHGKHPRGLFAIAGLTDNLTDFKSDPDDPENLKKKTNIKAIWTLAQDRQVIGCSLSNNELSIERIISTQGGFVYCMSACPVDTSQIAFGAGDTMIRLWNLSEPYEKVELQMFWEKIKGKVRSLAWHPEKENLLAFATNEGRVGVFDTNIKKPPILYRQYFRHIVYRVGWGPAPNMKEYALYACGDGESVYYDPEAPSKNPVSITKRKFCTEFSWKPDYSLLALGFGDGSMQFLNRDLTEFGHTIHTLNKAVQCFSWHPESTSSDLSISPLQNYLAVGVADTAITVFNISTKEDYEKNESMFYKTVATLNSHGDKVVCLAWSPHMSGYLVSGSYDYTAQVWKVETQEVIATYTAHTGPLQCCMWSPFSQDLIITGGADFTLRIWSISKQTAVAPPPLKNSTKSKRTKKKKTKEEVKHQNIIINGCKVEPKETNGVLVNKADIADQEQIFEEITDINKNVSKLMKKKKPKRITHFPGYGEINNNNKLWCSSIRTLLSIVKNSSQNNESITEKCDESKNVVNGEKKSANMNTELPIFFGSKTNLEQTLHHEKKILASSGNYNVIAEMDLWNNNLKDHLEDALKNKRLNDFLVALSPSVSKEMWEKMCDAYATQLIYEEFPHKAVSYLLCINKVLEAIDVFLTAKLFKEAYALASSRLDAKDPIIQNILKEWAENALKVGNFQNATECFIKLKEFEKAAKTLERRKDIDSLMLAIDLASAANDSDLMISLTEKAVAEALAGDDIPLAKSIIKHSQIQYREIEVEIFSELRKVSKTVNDLTIINWLKGLSITNLIETMSSLFPKCSDKYKVLFDSDIIFMSTTEKTVQMNFSHQLALSILSDQHKQKLQHLVQAFDIILQHEKTNCVNSDNRPFRLIYYVFPLENKIFSDSSIFNNTENEMSKSLRAYLCYAVITWFLNSKLDQDHNLECIDLIIIVIEKCIEDLLDKQSIKFWTTKNEITKVETQLSSIIGKSENAEENNEQTIEVETQKLIKRFEELKHDKQHFLDNRISSPNPLFSYGAVMEFIGKISNEQTCQKINDLVMSKWKKAIS